MEGNSIHLYGKVNCAYDRAAVKSWAFCCPPTRAKLRRSLRSLLAREAVRNFRSRLLRVGPSHAANLLTISSGLCNGRDHSGLQLAAAGQKKCGGPLTDGGDSKPRVWISTVEVSGADC